ncbi:peptidoglycan DD-metalloendopeptidase family protein [Micropruina sp.]|uniref:peptidoglycan DD-metalloendopeptidase family protein n=1 Tax=Micropruina sp. TaxID=2737536 RepID=UPI0039E27AF2
MPTTIDLAYPFTGRWRVRNSPANRVPSHGITVFATSYAIDFVPVDAAGRSGPATLGALFYPQPPEQFVGFGRPLLAPVAGLVVGAYAAEPDHPAYRGLPSFGYALAQRRRAADGWAALAGNHVMIEHAGVVVALCHLQQGSLLVEAGQRVEAGQPIGRCGNSGNSTEPHLHLQALDHPDPVRAGAVPISFAGGLPGNGEVVEVTPGPPHNQST